MLVVYSYINVEIWWSLCSRATSLFITDGGYYNNIILIFIIVNILYSFREPFSTPTHTRPDENYFFCALVDRYFSIINYYYIPNYEKKINKKNTLKVPP